MKEPLGSKNLISDIAHSSGQYLHQYKIPQSFQLQPDIDLISNLSGNYGALFIRAILNKLGFDEDHLFKWRLEHKLNQYELLNYYSPGCMPETFSFANVFTENDGLEKVKLLLKEGFFIKASLGDASLATNSWDKTAELDDIIKIQQEILIAQQPYLLQKRLLLQSEYRVHTFCQEILPALTYVAQGNKMPGAKVDIENFVEQVMARLPSSITEGAFIAWDIGLCRNHDCFVIEANLTGNHPQYRAGFQTTGYVDNHKYGPIICAWLNKYFRINWGISVNSIEMDLYQKHPLYQFWTYYNSILTETHLGLYQSQADDRASFGWCRINSGYNCTSNFAFNPS